MSRGAPRRNPRLDAVLAELAEPLAAGEDRLLEQLAEQGRATPEGPCVLVVGAPRSGTTLLVQWLGATGLFGVPSNVMARFSASPGLAARVQSVLFDAELRYGDQLDDLAARPSFESDLGKTRGALAPNEFFFFWRRHLDRSDLAPLGDAVVDGVDWGRVRAELAAIESGLGRPVATKGLMLQYDLPRIAAHLPEALFVFVRREPFFNAQSLLAARERFHGDRAAWYSTRPPGSDALDERTPFEQVAGQVHLDRRAIEAGMAQLAPERAITIDYEDFCADTTGLWSALRERCDGLPAASGAPGAFDATNRVRLDDVDAGALREACDRAARGALV